MVERWLAVVMVVVPADGRDHDCEEGFRLARGKGAVRARASRSMRQTLRWDVRAGRAVTSWGWFTCGDHLPFFLSLVALSRRG